MGIFLIWGANGWIGTMVCKCILDQGHVPIIASSRLQDYAGINKELDLVKPDYVMNCAGSVGVPNIDWNEDHKQDTYMTNTIGTVNLTDACWRKGIHVTYYATGCIYNYDKDHPIGSGFTEEDEPNYEGSTYSVSKKLSERILREYDNILILRIRMPISDDLHNKSIITKLTKYSKVINVPNSMTVLSEMIPISIKMTLDNCKGIYNFTNPGAISHNEILELYKKYIDHEFIWNNFTEDEQNKILKSKRCNCQLDTSKLTARYPVSEIHDAVEKVMKKISGINN